MSQRLGERDSRARVVGAPRLDPPPEVREIASTLQARGFETWCVGGAVRDALLGIPHLDWDLATAATPPEIKRTFRRTVPVGEEFGTIGVLDGQGRLHEVTTFRRDVKTDGRHAVVEFGASLAEDLARRDFTINAIAYSPGSGELFDPFDGRGDLERGVVRAVGDARARMTEDRLRALRAIRFAGRLAFRIDDATWRAIGESAPYLSRLSRERVKQELEKTMEQVRYPSRAMELWRTSGALAELLPLIERQPAWARAGADWCALPDDCSDEGRARRRTLVRLATLFVGLSHDEARRALRELRFSNRDGDWVAHLAACASELRGRMLAVIRQGADGGRGVVDAELRRWGALAGRLRLADALRVTLASLHASGELSLGDRAKTHALYRRALRLAFTSAVELSDLRVDGEELMREGGVARGPALGAMLRRLLEVVLDDPSRNDREVLLALAREWSSHVTSAEERR